MRKLLMIVIFLNTLDVIGKLITIIFASSSDLSLLTKLGAAFDAVLWHLYIVIIGVAVLFLYKVEPKQDA